MRLMRGYFEHAQPDFTLRLRPDGDVWILTALSEPARAWLRERFVCKSDVVYIFRDRIDKFADSIRASGLTILESNTSFVN